MNFVDIHTHILPGLDDGAPDMKIASEMLRISYGDGINRIIMTPHHITGMMENSRQRVEDAVERMREVIRAEKMDMEIYPGSEIYLDMDTVNAVSNSSVCTLNGSRYVLVELPLHEIPAYASEALFELSVSGYVPIMAHPERNKEIIENPLVVQEFIHNGSLVQINSSSLRGLYGRKARMTACTLLRLGLVHFVATDAHSVTGRKPLLKAVYESVESEFGMEYARKLFVDNGLSVIRDEEIPIKGTKKSKQSRRKSPLAVISRFRALF